MKLDNVTSSQSNGEMGMKEVETPKKMMSSHHQPADSDGVDDPLCEEWDLMREVANSGQQEDAFLVCNVSKITENVQRWKELVPQARPYYGELIGKL